MEALDESVFQMSGISFHIVHFNKLETQEVQGISMDVTITI